MKTFADKVIAFNAGLKKFDQPLPPGIRIMNPYKEATAMSSAKAFYKKFYDDHAPRKLILGINPGRFGAGLTGVPFTDPKRLIDKCGVSYVGDLTHEPSSVFVYEMIDAYGGAEKFYDKFYITSVCPLGFTFTKPNGRVVNYNYYDNKLLSDTVNDFMIESTKKQLGFGLDKTTVFCFGAGKNKKFIEHLNKTHQFFDRLLPLEHPRYIMQYKSREKSKFIDKYLRAFEDAGN